MWLTLENIAARERMSTSQLTGMIDAQRGGLGLTPAIRVFLIAYLSLDGQADSLEDALNTFTS